MRVDLDEIVNEIALRLRIDCLDPEVAHRACITARTIGHMFERYDENFDMPFFLQQCGIEGDKPYDGDWKKTLRRRRYGATG